MTRPRLLIAAVREERITASMSVMFLHTGGLPAVFTPRYAAWLTG